MLRSQEIVGRSLATVVGDAARAKIVAALAEGKSRSTLVVETPTGRFDATVHRSDGLAVVELEPTQERPELTLDEFRNAAAETLSNIDRAVTLAELAGSIAAQMRRLTGFDRVWVYRFHEDWHGEIIGEAKSDRIEPWLGLHYPASDIPAQARALFLKNWLRMIPDISFRPVPIQPVLNPLTDGPLDLGNSVLRSVSPIHIEYLTNMGVTASLVISLIHNGKLWGLISGHHYSGPKHVPMPMRALCEFLAQALSLHVGIVERVDDRERALETRRIEGRLRARFTDVHGYRHALVHGSPTLMDLTRASGASICDERDCVCIGKTPTADDLRRLTEWLRAKGDDVFHTTSLARAYPPAAAWADIGSGLLAVALSPKRPHYLLWFRGEARQTIRWAGDPNKAVANDGPNGAPRLSPRGSFTLWEEERRGTSEVWEETEIAAALDLRRTLLDLLLARAEEVALLNAELEMANQSLSETAVELETQTEALLQQRKEREEILLSEQEARKDAQRANRAKSDFLAMMSHELRTPLNAIAGYSQMLEMGVRGPINDEQVRDLRRIQHNQQHLLGLITDILSFAKIEAGHVPVNWSTFDTKTALLEIEGLVLPQLMEKGLVLELHYHEGGSLVYADPERVRQILLNLVSNAIKFTDVGTITIDVRERDDAIQIVVSDTGRGIPENRLESIFEPFIQVEPSSGGRTHGGVGLGLAISRELARAMNGELSATSRVGHGSTFTLAIPRRQPAPSDVANASPTR